MTIETSTNEAPRAATPGALRPRILSTPSAPPRVKPQGARAQLISKNEHPPTLWRLVKS